MVTLTNVLVLLAMVVGTVGIILPVLPGLLLVWLAFLVWAIDQPTSAGWIPFAIATALYAAGVVTQYLFPGRRLKAAGTPTWLIALALVVAVVGLFAVPVIGAPLGFVGSVYLMQQVRYRDAARAWTGTKHALKAVALGIGIELLTAMAMISTWGVAVFLGRA